MFHSFAENEKLRRSNQNETTMKLTDQQKNSFDFPIKSIELDFLNLDNVSKHEEKNDVKFEENHRFQLEFLE